MLFFLFFKQKTAYEMRISDWSSDVCSSDLRADGPEGTAAVPVGDVDRHLIQARALHLRRDGALPDQLVDGGLFGRQIARHVLRPAHQVGRPYRFVRFLGVARRTAIGARRLRQIGVAIVARSEENTSELQSLMRISYAGFCM